MSQAQTAERPKPARWREKLHQDSFLCRSHRHWIVHGKVLTPTEEEAEEMKDLNLDAYDFQQGFVEATRKHCVVI